MNRPHTRAVPEEGSIQPGKVVRIEAYGCFVDLTNYYRLRGLVHISQLAGFKVDQVEDVVALDDPVWVKVLQVEETQPPPQPRYKISLSLKDASQDGSATDLGAVADRHQHLQEQISNSLTSSIGMGVALDPMAAAAAARGRASNLVLKQKGGAPATIINGYALVDDEDEFGEDPATLGKATGSGPPASAAATSAAADIKPRGRGRGTTLPAWMTRQAAEGGPTGVPDKKKEDDEDDDSRQERKHRRKHKKSSSDSQRHRKHRSRRHHRRDDQYDDADDKHKDDDNASKSDASYRKRKRKRHSKDHHRSKSRHRRHRRSRSPSRSGSRSSPSRSPDRHRRRHSHTPNTPLPFQSVEDAQRLIERLEAKKHENQPK